MPQSLPELIRAVIVEHLTDESLLDHIAHLIALNGCDHAPKGRWYEHEQLYPIKAPKSLGEKKCANTLRNWAKKGLKGPDGPVVLESTYRGRGLFTSKERLLAFYRRLNGIKA